jgi:hypothetical protein
MIVGLTPTGAVKTKTDGGLRAVSCACCGVCGCDVVRRTATPELIELLQNATGATNNGLAATTFDSDYPNDPEINSDWPVSWSATWCFDGINNCNYFLYAGWYGWETDPTSDFYHCFFMFGVRRDVFPFTAYRALEIGTSACPPLNPGWVNSNDANFTINGEKFPCYQSYDPAQPLAVMDIPNLVFT